MSTPDDTAGAHPEEWSPFGRGWTTAALAAVTMAALLLARRYGAGAYGAGAVPFLFLYVVLTAVIAGRAAAGLAKPLWPPLRLAAAVGAACAAAIVVFRTWNTQPVGEPLLVPMFVVIVGPALVWALFAPPRARNGAGVTAVVTLIALLVAHTAGL